MCGLFTIIPLEVHHYKESGTGVPGTRTGTGTGTGPVQLYQGTTRTLRWW